MSEKDYKKLEQELLAARQDAESAQHLKRLFMANVSHELRTPLNAILGFTNLLMRSELAPELKEYVENIQVSGYNLLAIVKDILDFEKIRSGQLRIDRVEFELPALLHSVIAGLRPAAEQKELDLRVELDADLPLQIIGDPMRLTQVLVKIIGNAIKFTEKGLVVLRARMVQSAEGDRLHLEIEDTGIGVPTSHHQLIFERFEQSSSGATREYGGTGLGLAIVKMIVELQEGSILLKSEPGQGALFIVEIPCQSVVPVSSVSIAPLVEVDALPNLSGYHVLLVEDNPMNRRMAEIHLREFGLEVTLAENGREAVECLQANPGIYDLVCMDIEMPEMDGYAATRMIRSELGLRHLPIVAVTAHVLAGEREKVIASGMNDFLTKPVGHQEVITLLLRYLSNFWDPNVLQEYALGKPDNTREIAELFMRLFPKDLAALHQALRQKNFKQMADMAHNLRGTVAYTGFQSSLGACLLQIEEGASESQPDLLVLTDLYRQLLRDGNYAMSILQHEFLQAHMLN